MRWGGGGGGVRGTCWAGQCDEAIYLRHAILEEGGGLIFGADFPGLLPCMKPSGLKTGLN